MPQFSLLPCAAFFFSPGPTPCPASTPYSNPISWKSATRSTRPPREILTRFDFKGSSSKVELKEKELTIWADSDFQIGQVMDILVAKLTKRSVDIRFLDRSAKIERSAATRSSS